VAAKRTERSAANKQILPAAPAPADFEGLGVFYLGRAYDLQAKSRRADLILYDSKDLVTHAVCVGMTGSGKTGLCVSLLEEAALDGIPAIVIDPKGDLSNLMLTFPQLRPEDFRPWINEDDARQKGVSPDDYAAQQATMWKQGLEAWGESGDRIGKLRDAVDVAIYTPGSRAGIPVSILSSFAAPPQAARDDEELLNERITTVATSLLTLMGIDADPVRSREHILIANLLGAAWRAGTDVDLPGLIQQIQTPPMTRIGVLDLESFFPAVERFALAMRVNNLLASPGFALWMEGDAFDIGRFLHSTAGKPKISIFSIAHLSDTERMFFVSLLLNQVLAWMRAQSGTTSLRAILYMDEIFGYFPPVANPPSKQPLLTLLKQARAFGVGVVLATQNPVDLDYKGLSNAGTWFLGRLQTGRDKERVLEGLEGVAAGASVRFDRGGTEQILAGLGSRVFMLHNVHDDAPVVFETRWAMSYLRGPLTREQIKRLMDPIKSVAAPPTAPGTASAAAVPAASMPPQAVAPRGAGAGARPVLPPDVPQFFVRPLSASGGQIQYRPMVYGAAQVQFQDTKLGVDVTHEVACIAPITTDVIAVDWAQAQPSELVPGDLEREPVAPAEFGALPSVAARAKSYEGWGRDFGRWLLQTQRVELLRHPASGEISAPGEGERDFRVKVQQAARESRDAVAEKLRQKYAPKITVLQERLRRAEAAVARERAQSQNQQMQTAVSIGATLIGAFLGRRALSTGTVGRATTAARSASRAYQQAKDIGQAQNTVASVQAQLAELEAQFKAEVDAAGSVAMDAALEAVAVKPKRTGISVKVVTLVWVPLS
jgi:hypothetical protein